MNIVEQLFNSQFAAEIAEEDKDSMSADIKNKFELYESPEDNMLDIAKLREALLTGALDIELFKQTLK